MLTPAEIDHFRSRLENDRRAINAQLDTLRRQLASPQDASGREGDEGDSATQIYTNERVEAEIERYQDQLKQIDSALLRIADGSYGFSQVSGKPIPIERLEALPTATTLVEERHGA